MLTDIRNTYLGHDNSYEQDNGSLLIRIVICAFLALFVALVTPIHFAQLMLLLLVFMMLFDAGNYGEYAFLEKADSTSTTRESSNLNEQSEIRFWTDFEECKLPKSKVDVA